jgi:acyl dehydratase
MEVLLLLSLLCAIPLSLLIWGGYRLSSLLASTKHAEITFPPHELRPQEVVLAILTMIVKSIFYQTSKSRAVDNKNDSGEMTLSSPFSINEEDISRYHRAAGSLDRTGELSDLALPVFLSAVTEPAMLLLLASLRCPINPLGAVNVRNRFEVLRPELCQPRSFMRQHTAGLVAKVRNGSRTVNKGIEYDLEVAIMVPDHAGTSGVELIPVFRQIFTMLEFRRTKSVDKSGSATTAQTVPTVAGASMGISKIAFSSNDPLKWAALWKDYNLIHLAGLAAKSFGLPGKLAHGNHVVAKAIQQLEDDKKLQWSHKTPIIMEVQFKRPVIVPNVLTVQVQQRTLDEREVSISCGDRANVILGIGKL